MLKYYILIIVALLFSNHSHAQQEATKTSKETTKKQKASLQKTIQVKFGNEAWNKSADKLDSGVVVLRDARSKKIVQILLEETAPNSGVFSGTYWVDWGRVDKVRPEVYVLDRTELASETEFKVIVNDIAEGKISKKPLFYRRNAAGFQTLEVFETKEQSNEALALLKNQLSWFSNDTTTAGKTFQLGTLLEADELKEHITKDNVRRKVVQKKIVDRYRKEKNEQVRIAQLQKNFQKQPQQEQQKKQELSNKQEQEALKLFKAQSYQAAADGFKESFETNPLNIGSYFQYAISLYKNKNYDEALIALSISSKNKGFEHESMYYQGISHFEASEYELALQVFNKIQETQDVKYAALASFYKGLTYFEMKMFSESKQEFQRVLDTSEDTNLDNRAEKYLESIDQVIAFSKVKKQKFFISGTLGAMYDSNVLQTSDSSSDQGSSSDQADFRYLVGVGFYWRPIYKKEREFGVKLRTDYIYTKKDELSDFDPWSFQLSTPYAMNTTLWNKNYRLTLKPGYELLHLGQNEPSGRPLKLLNAYFLDWGNTFEMNPSWMSTYSLILRKDNFVYDDTKDALKWTLKYSNIYFLDESKRRGLLGDIAYVNNNAKEDINKFSRYELSLMYLSPLPFQELTFIGGLSTYILKYSERNPSQQDFNKTLNVILSRPLWNNITGSLLGTYTINDSDVNSSEYNKWTIGFVLNGEFGF